MNAKAELYQFIDEMRNQYALLCYCRDINSFCINNNIDLYVHNFDLSGFCGAAFVGKKHDTIVLNGRRNQYEMFFDFIHELIHTKKHRDLEEQAFTCFDRKQNSFLEWEANEGAAEFLVSYRLFIPAFSELYDVYENNYALWKQKYGITTITQELADMFAVTEMIIINRIRNLSYEIDQYREGTSVNNIYLLSGNQQTMYNITPTNYSEKVSLIQAQHIFEIPWDGILSANY